MKALVLAALLLLRFDSAQAQQGPHETRLRAIYQELVEINTTDAVGDCTAAANAMGRHLLEAGLSARDVQVLVPPDAPRKGNLVARLRGSSAAKPLLLLAHIDVVEAKREDWQRDPFKLTEEDGFFYARGASDDKAMAAIYTALLARFQAEGLKLARDLILALTCDEEGGGHNGARFLLQQHRALIDAELALNEGAGGALSRDGQPMVHRIQAGEKVIQTFRLEVTNKGGHSSTPEPDNAIYRLADGLGRLAQHSFPIQIAPVTRAYLQHVAKTESPGVAEDIRLLLREPPDAAALQRLWRVNAGYSASVRTTCVATQLEAGHASNALPQRARATVNCRILPGERIDAVQAELERVLADAQIQVSRLGDATEAPLPPMKEPLMDAIRAVSDEIWPGVPVVPAMSTGATDGRFLNHAGLWTYGVTGLFHPPGGSNAHGLNERLRVRSFYEAYEFNRRLLLRLAR
jgi:acetylornithine deacetylase/succinyl-diaminopimelate desuccinylase-like protein